jgi:hypothetical protein
MKNILIDKGSTGYNKKVGLLKALLLIIKEWKKCEKIVIN